MATTKKQSVKKISTVKKTTKPTPKKKVVAKKPVAKKATKDTPKKKVVTKKPVVKKATKATPKKKVVAKKATKVKPTSKNVKVKFNSITKVFGKLIANDNINFSVMENEVHALLGENGAGKSTLMSILFGLYTPTSGNIEINGEVIKIKDPRHANELKIAMLPQHFKLVENMTVFENVILGYEKLNGNSVSQRKEHLNKLAEQFNLSVDINARIEKLSIADMQKAEILKILWRDADIIIFDEPTSILTPQEIESFLEMVKYMQSIGKTILLITHKLHEIREVANRVTIIRKGKYIATKEVNKVTDKQLAELMVGKSVDLNLSNIKRTKIDEKNALNTLKIEGLNYKGSGYETSLENINLNIKKGEIVGIAAIDGNGQSELVKILSGLYKASSGSIKINEESIEHKSIKQRYFDSNNSKEASSEDIQSYKDAITQFKSDLKAAKNNLQLAKVLKDEIKIAKYQKEVAKFKGQIQHTNILLNKPQTLISHIPEDRHEFGLVLDYTVSKNIVLQDIDFYTRFGFLVNRDIQSRTNYIVDKYDVRGVVTDKIKARALSGGNQQKLILGREIERNPKLLLAAHPTRGLDVGAIRNVYENIIKSRNEGMSVLLLSGELDEIMQVSDRIIVMYDGKIVSSSERGKLSKLQLGALMAGGKK